MHDALGIDVEHADLGGHDDQVVLGDVVAAGAQAVAVEDGADLRAVGEGDRGGAVPRLHQAGVVFVESLAWSCGMPLCLAHGSGIIMTTACASGRPERTRNSRQLSNMAESLPSSWMTGLSLLDVLAEERRGELRLAGVHPVDVAAQGVDLAVVGDVAVRVGAVPAREGVGAETRVDQRQRAFHARVGQVRDRTPPPAPWSACPCRQWCGRKSSGCRRSCRRERRRSGPR